MRINNSPCPRKLLRRLVVICDNKFHIKLSNTLSFLNRGNAVIHGDDKLNTLFCKHFNSFHVHAISSFTLRNIVHNVCAHAFKIVVKYSGGRNSIAVIVTVNTNKVILINRLVYHLGGYSHILYKKRVTKFFAFKKISKAVKVSEPP